MADLLKFSDRRSDGSERCRHRWVQERMSLTMAAANPRGSEQLILRCRHCGVIKNKRGG